ncbi:MAG TPA: carboxypeptidase M32 [Rhizomicrobium sp.]|jgi:carboxypeptidase Taq|nr:carboxypeptidase M32 [Rhizomicrobium sp.]
MPPSAQQADPYARAAEKFALSCKLASIESLLMWDAQTNMPKGGAWARGEQIGALAEITSELTGNKEIGDLLQEAQTYAHRLSAAERANLNEMKRLWVHRAAVPKELLVERARVSQALQSTWIDAKANSDFASFAPGFEKLMAIHKEVAAAKGAALGLQPYDAMMDEQDPGLTTATIDPIFDDLASELPGILMEVRERQARWPQVIAFSGDFSIPRQAALSERLAKTVGHSPQNSRIDVAPHPFSMPHSPGDVRFTTRYDIDKFRYSVMATLHEAGHSMYEFNLPRTHAFSPAGFARGASAHESQSLMLEMMAGRSREFLQFLAPLLREYFGGDKDCWSPTNVLNYFRRVDDDYIRVEADEISYPLHVILRYRLERALLAGDLSVDDVPGAWNELFKKLFGRVPPNHAKGCLQDIHWAAALFGYFPNYALGESLAAQLFERAKSDDGTILPALRTGDFKPYFNWVRPRIHEQASLKSFDDIVIAATGDRLSGAALKRHLRARYLEEPLD